MAEDKKNVDLKLSSLSRFGLRGRGRGGGPSRLPSLKPARDLTLGGTPKRTFTPNIVSRGVKKEEAKDDYDGNYRGRRGQSHRGRGRTRGRGRGRGEIVAASGIFSQGPAAQQTLAAALSGGSGFTGSGSHDRDDAPGSSKTNITSMKGDREDEIESDKVLEMLKDEGKIEMDEDEVKLGSLMPITLPLASKLVHKIKQDDVKTESDLSQDEDDSTRVKQRVRKPIVKKPEAPPLVEIADLFKEDVPEGQLFFLQLPDTLPIKPIAQDDSVKTETNEASKENADDNDYEEHLKQFTFQNVSEGYIGKLQIHKSGKVKMRLGNVTLDVSVGTPCGFLQDLISVHTEKEPAEMVCLGHVQHRLIAVPNYKSLVGSLDL